MKQCSLGMEGWGALAALVGLIHMPGGTWYACCTIIRWASTHPETLSVFWYFQIWTHWDLNPGPSACEADVMPLHHVPLVHCRTVMTLRPMQRQ